MAQYEYKRYRLSLDVNNPQEIKIAEYLDSYKAGKARNQALVNLILAGMGESEKVFIPDNVKNPAYTMQDKRLLSIEEKIDNLFLYLQQNENTNDSVIKNADIKFDHDSEWTEDIAGEQAEPEELTEPIKPAGQLHTDISDANMSADVIEPAAMKHSEVSAEQYIKNPLNNTHVQSESVNQNDDRHIDIFNADAGSIPDDVFNFLDTL